MSQAGLSSPASGAPAPPPTGATGGADSPPPLDQLMRSAGLGGVADAAQGVGDAVAKAGAGLQSTLTGLQNLQSPPPLQDLMHQAGLTDTAPAPAPAPASPSTPAVTPPADGTAPADTHQSQFAMGLSTADAIAACGLAAATGFARRFGRNPTGEEARQLAIASGWDNQNGMHGVLSEKALLDKMGVASRLESNDPNLVRNGEAAALDWNHITRDAMNGNPVILDTPGHYLYVDGARQRDDGTVEYHVGTQGTDLSVGGAPWMTRAEIEAHPVMAGAVRSALYADSPLSPHPSVANTTSSATETTAGLSGGGALAGKIGDAGQQILSAASGVASWLGDQGQKALQAVLVTEGGLSGARGDNGKSAGPLQFYEQGQLANFAQQMSMTLEQAKTWVEQHPVDAVQWAIGTAQNPGYLGRAIADGLAKGLTGSDLATYAQQHGQVSVSPERAGANYNAMFGSGQSVVTAADTGTTADYAQLATSGADIAHQGDVLTRGLTPTTPAVSPTAAVEQEATRRAQQLSQALQTTVDQGRDYVAPKPLDVPTMAADQPNPVQRFGQQIADGVTGLVKHLTGQTQEPMTPSMMPTGSDTLTRPPMQDQPTTPPVTPSNLPPAQETLGHMVSSSPLGQVQVPELGSVPGGPVGVAVGAGASALGTAVHGVSGALREISPASWSARGVAGTDQLSKDYAAAGGPELEQQLQELFRRQDAGETGLDSQIETISNRLNEITHAGQAPYGQQVFEAAERNPSLPALETASNLAAGAVAAPLAIEGAPLTARLFAEVLQPGTNPLELLHGVNELVTGREVATNPEVASAVRDAFQSYGQRMADTAAERARQIEKIGDPRGFLERVRDALVGALAGGRGDGGAPRAGITADSGVQAGATSAGRSAASAVEDAAVARFGTTDDPRRASWILSDGRALDLGRDPANPLTSAADHSEIASALEDAGARNPRVAPIDDAVGKTGMVRFGVMGDELWADVRSPLTAEQSAFIRNAASEVGGTATIETGSGARRFTFPQDMGEFNRFIRSREGGTQAPPAVDRFYHGTAGAFDRPDASKFDPNGLFGPGYYLTDSPQVAGGLVGQGVSESEQVLQDLIARRNAPDVSDRLGFVLDRDIAKLQRQVDIEKGGPTVLSQGYAQARGSTFTELYQPRIDDLNKQISEYERIKNLPQYRNNSQVASAMDNLIVPLREKLAGLEAFAPDAGPNVRAVDVPSNLRLLDADARVAPELSAQMAEALRNAGADPEKTLDNAFTGASGADMWGMLKARAGGSSEANDILQQAGYDGIRYSGGKRIPMQDAAGQNIEHTAVVVFPQSLDKLTNATAGTRGGLLAGTDNAPGGLVRSLAPRAVVGGTGAAYQESQRPDATPESVATAGLQGAGLGVARGLGARYGLRLPVASAARVAQAIGSAPGARDFDLNKLAQMRAQYQANQPPLVQAAARTPGKVDRIIGYTAANMLSGVGTAVQNTLGNAGQTVARPLFTAAGGHPSDAARDVMTMAHTMSDAFAAYGRTFTTGQRTGQHYQATVGSLKNPLSYPLRNLGATDEFFRTLNGAGAAAAEASRRLRENPSLSFDDVLQRYPQQIMDAGSHGAARAVLEEGGGAMAALGRNMAQWREGLLHSANPGEQALGLAMQWIVPMTRVPGVVLGEGVRGLPVVNEAVGLTRAANRMRQGEHYAAQQELGRTAMQSFANLAILAQVADGNITGDGPENAEEKARLMEAVDANGNAVWRPNSVRLPGGRWLDYSGLGPIALSMSSIANLVDTAKDWAQKPPEQRGGIPELALDLGKRELKTIGNAWYLKGLADILGVVKDGNVEKLGTNFTSIGDRLIPAESLLNEIRRVADPITREPDNPLQREANRIPFLSSTVPPRYTATTGNPVQDPRDILSTIFRGTPGGAMQPNPVATEISRLNDAGLKVSAPKQNATYAGAKQNDEQLRLLQQTTGQAVSLYALNVMADPSYAKANDRQKADALNHAIAEAQQAADVDLGGRVARDPKNSALLAWSQTPHYSGVKGTPDEVAKQNFLIAEAKSKLAAYKTQYGDQGEGRLRREDPSAAKLAQRDRIDSDRLAKAKKAIDAAFGGALLNTSNQAGTAGLVGVGSTVLEPPQ